MLAPNNEHSSLCLSSSIESKTQGEQVEALKWEAGLGLIDHSPSVPVSEGTWLLADTGCF